jgi:hypothetical protein
MQREREERQQRRQRPPPLLGVNSDGELPIAGESLGWCSTSSGERF